MVVWKYGISCVQLNISLIHSTQSWEIEITKEKFYISVHHVFNSLCVKYFSKNFVLVMVTFVRKKDNKLGSITLYIVYFLHSLSTQGLCCNPNTVYVDWVVRKGNASKLCFIQIINRIKLFFFFPVVSFLLSSTFWEEFQ